jgi:hypothetical protein
MGGTLKLCSKVRSFEKDESTEAELYLKMHLHVYSCSVKMLLQMTQCKGTVKTHLQLRRVSKDCADLSALPRSISSRFTKPQVKIDLRKADRSGQLHDSLKMKRFDAAGNDWLHLLH